MSRKIVLALFALLLLLSLTHAARPFLPNPSDLPQETQQGGVENEEGNIEGDDGCQGLDGDECLIKRSLAAHTDYIYTQNANP